MPLNYNVIDRLAKQIGPSETGFYVELAKKHEAFELLWLRKLRNFYKEISHHVARSLLETGRFPAESKLQFDDFFIEHYFAASKMGWQSIDNRYANRIPARMAKKPPKKPTMGDLMKQWDLWRKGKYKPRKPAEYAKQLKKQYLRSIHEYWRDNSQRFLKGEEYTQEDAMKKLTEELGMTEGRARNVVRTETTRYYTEVRKTFYDKVPDVTHYLYVAIRDMRTSEWCTAYEKGGRDGLVYTKGSKLADRESPPVHWNCRSEILPLDPDNPKHKSLIDDKSLRRENHSPKPLPKGFNHP